MGYAELEIGLMNCVQIARDDLNSVLKAMFRPRGEAQRIDIGDGLGRQLYRDLGLGTQFEMSIGNMRFCLKIRNQYAHCIWHDDHTGMLGFVNLEQIAESNDFIPDLSTGLTTHYVDEKLLKEQEQYFSYVIDSIRFLNYEARFLQKKIATRIAEAPKQVQRPRFHLTEADRTTNP